MRGINCTQVPALDFAERDLPSSKALTVFNREFTVWLHALVGARAGTLTQNEMAVARMWLAGHEFDNVQFLSGVGTSVDGKV